MERERSRLVPYSCPVCRATPGEFYGKLLPEGADAFCPNEHKELDMKVRLVRRED